MKRSWLWIGGAGLLLALLYLPDLLGIGTGQLLAFLLVLACPLMHFFMGHGIGHGGHDHARRDAPDASTPGRPALRAPDSEETTGSSR